MDILERVEYAILNKYYGKLLTEKQREIINMYVDNNLSFGEIGNELKISRQAVKNALDTSLKSLKDLEFRLQFVARDAKIKEILDTSGSCTLEETKAKILSLLED